MDGIARLGASSYLLFTTFHRDGRAVPTPVWVQPQRFATCSADFSSIGEESAIALSRRQRPLAERTQDRRQRRGVQDTQSLGGAGERDI